MQIDQIIDEFLGKNKEWTGSATALWTELVERFGADQLPVTHANTLSRMLNTRNAELRDRGIDVEHGRLGVARRITLRRMYPAVDLIKCPRCKITVVKIIKNRTTP